MIREQSRFTILRNPRRSDSMLAQMAQMTPQGRRVSCHNGNCLSGYYAYSALPYSSIQQPYSTPPTYPAGQAYRPPSFPSPTQTPRIVHTRERIYLFHARTNIDVGPFLPRPRQSKFSDPFYQLRRPVPEIKKERSTLTCSGRRNVASIGKDPRVTVPRTTKEFTTYFLFMRHFTGEAGPSKTVQNFHTNALHCARSISVIPRESNKVTLHRFIAHFLTPEVSKLFSVLKLTQSPQQRRIASRQAQRKKISGKAEVQRRHSSIFGSICPAIVRFEVKNKNLVFRKCCPPSVLVNQGLLRSEVPRMNCW